MTGDQVSPKLSLRMQLISTAAPKLVQLRSTRPVSGSMSLNTLSAKAAVLVTGVATRGALQVTPPSVETWMQRLDSPAGVR